MVTFHLLITYCMLLNPSMCRALEVVPAEHKMTTPSDCMRGGMMGSAEFTADGARWFVKGFYCREDDDVVADAIGEIKAKVTP